MGSMSFWLTGNIDRGSHGDPDREESPFFAGTVSRAEDLSSKRCHSQVSSERWPGYQFLQVIVFATVHLKLASSEPVQGCPCSQPTLEIYWLRRMQRSPATKPPSRGQDIVGLLLEA